MDNVYFILNSTAGNGSAVKKFNQAEKVLRERNISYKVLESKYQGNIKELVAEAISSGADCIVIVGGDGSVRESISALAYKDVAFSIFPFGTGNDCAKALGLSEDPNRCVHDFINGKPQKIDAARANESYFLNVAGFGFDVDVLVNTEHFKNKHNGKTAYRLGLFTALTHMKQRKVIINADGREYQYKSLIASAGNGKYIGGGMNAHPNAEFDDGLLEFFCVHDLKPLQIPGALSKFLKGEHLDLKNTKYFRAKKIQVQSEDELAVQLDGEIIEMTPVTFEILPEALTIIK
ncbi:MAG: diacylglycerol kinase family lipid kinase [Lachnospiraceae bacterium]|jgi:YegS/Rv2252/BmrU family lipid kinase|nr:diacylglycerol kinase family lipid kinase [Lachnospiraceae bacterium]